MLKIDPLTIIAFAIGLVALVLAVKRDRRRPPLAMNREEELLQRVATLERDIAGLQRMLVEKQNEIDRLNDRIRQLERGQTVELGPPVEAVRYVHFGVHSDQRGLYLADGVATWEWLSERLDGVDVVVLAGCSNDRIADKLRVVDAVVSVRAREIQNKDASLFVEVFWLAIGNGSSAQQAFEQALERAPARVGEFVELHL